MVRLLPAAAAAPITLPAAADTLVRWNVNSAAPDANTGTGITLPATGDDSGWRVTTFAAQGSGDGTRGAAFATRTGVSRTSCRASTCGTATPRRATRPSRTPPTTAAGSTALLDADNGGDKRYSPSVDFSAIGTVDGSVLTLATRAQGAAAGAFSQVFMQAGTVMRGRGVIDTVGDLGVSTLQVSGPTVTPVPEPGTAAPWLAGLAGLGVMRRARRAAR
ncbi:MAG: hypothetical protein Fur0014_02360 [Rubrivivax sp.]